MASSAPDLTSRILRREGVLIAVSVAALAALGWWYILGHGTIGRAAGMARMSAPPLSALTLMWFLMMVAMMVPSGSPVVLLYARVRGIRSGDSAVAPTSVFLAGYLIVWLMFSILAAVAQLMLTGPSMALNSRLAEAAVLLLVGAYQLTPLKAACVRQCRSPGDFLSRYWRPGLSGAILLGVRHGAYCLGCCWLLMALLFVGGVMNLLWIVGLTLLVAVEKLAPSGLAIGRVAGIVMIVAAAVTLVA
jgi:predicted metal-binding membrane protein